MPRGISKKAARNMVHNPKGAGFFDDLWSGIKTIGEDVATGVGQGLGAAITGGDVPVHVSALIGAACHIHRIEKHLQIPHRLEGIDHTGGLLTDIAAHYNIPAEHLDNLTFAGIHNGGSINVAGSEPIAGSVNVAGSDIVVNPPSGGNQSLRLAGKVKRTRASAGQKVMNRQSLTQ